MHIDSASPELRLQEGANIGLAVNKQIFVPSRNLLAYMTLQKVIAEGGIFAFYDPADIDYVNHQGTAPYDTINYRLTPYSHVTVNDQLLF